MGNDQISKTCWTCAKSYHGGESLCCGEGSSVEPAPFWATEAAFFRILENGTKTGRERADDIDHTMASECAAYAPSDKEIPAHALINFPGWVQVQKDGVEIIRAPEPPSHRDDLLNRGRRHRSLLPRPQLRDNEELVEFVGDGKQIIETTS